MPVDAILWNLEQNQELHAAAPHDDNACLVVTNYMEAHGTFQALTTNSTVAAIVASPNLGQGLLIDSMIVFARKHTNKEYSLQLTDDTQTEVLLTADLTNEDLKFTFAVPNGWKGWKNARLEVVTTSTKVITTTVGYAKVPKADTFSAWDAQR